jgi:hypothetical protein
MKNKPFAWATLLVIVFAATVLACSAASRISQLINTPRGFLGAPSAPVPPASLTPAATSAACPHADCANACMAQLGSIAQAGGSLQARRGPTRRGQPAATATVLVTYPIDGDKLGTPVFAQGLPLELSVLEQDTQSQENIWKYFAAIIPADQRSALTSYIVSTDGRGGMLASVEAFAGPSGAWALVVDPADAAKPRNLTSTLLHEFGHLLTLNSSQVQPDEAVLQHPKDLKVYSQEAAKCPQYFASVGCSLPGSYINQFYSVFWARLYKQWSTIRDASGQDNYSGLLARFYHSHPTQFVTPYAATSPEEDMAESWAAFVLEPRPADDSIAHQKVLFFYGFPELVDLRSGIVSNICSYTGRR